ncbi:MAG: aminoglycoside phosphotransferase family protein [Deltaproteobacteria bacterium]|nr:aminoglycoside phosphotransferase family protein [Deltaproteobacteria bacterium]
MSKSKSTINRICIHLREAAERFGARDRIAEISRFGAGNVNDTFLVASGSDRSRRFILQRINGRVFNMPEWIMQNLRVLSAHVSQRLTRTPPLGRRWEMVRCLPTEDLKDYWIDPEGRFWRAMSFIEDAQSFESVAGPEHATEVGFAVGFFHTLVSDLPPRTLKDTLEGFHVTPLYLRRYQAVLDAGPVPASSDTAWCIDFIEKRKALVHVLEDAKADGRLPLRIIHGDPKVSNVMIDKATKLAVSIVDLDTVKPGLIHYDIGDALRSCCNPPGEEAVNLDDVRFEPDLCQALLRGYFAAAKDFLTGTDREFVYDSVRLIAFELGLRFFTDFLEGDVYFSVNDRTQNLRRALVQFRLTESIESQAAVLQTIIKETK